MNFLEILTVIAIKWLGVIVIDYMSDVTAPSLTATGGLRQSPQPPTNFYEFHTWTHSFEQAFLWKQDIAVAAVSAITIENAKIFL